ncbi:uncharacterized protein LOC144797570 [Lissotriton helveticus]
MADTRNNRRKEAASKLFTKTEGGVESNEKTLTKKVDDVKKMWDALWKILKKEQSKWWEATALAKYVECNRIPRGLRIFIIPTFQQPDPELIGEWMTNNYACSMNMLNILIKYADKECIKLNAESEQIIAKLKEKYTESEFIVEMTKMEKRLGKIEEEIKEKKQRKFYRDEIDYDKGRILTFGKRFKVLRGTKKKSKKQGMGTNKQAVQQENGEEGVVPLEVTDSDTTESEISEQAESLNVKDRILNEFALMARGRQTGTPPKRSWMRRERRQKSKRRQSVNQHNKPSGSFNKGQEGTEMKNDMTVLNLSKHILSVDQLEVLSRGLLFCPTAKFNFTSARIDLFRFTRKLKLRKWFATKPRLKKDSVKEKASPFTVNDIETLHAVHELVDYADFIDDPFLNLVNTDINIGLSSASGVRPKSVFVPQIVNSSIECFEIGMIGELRNIERHKPKLNLNFTKKQFQALKELEGFTDVVIKNSDKGGNVVVWPLNMYLMEGLKQLGDSEKYSIATRQEYDEAKQEYFVKFSDWRDQGTIEDEEYRYLLCKHPQIPALYLLPKLHTNLEAPPGRPIVSSTGSLLENTSRYIDFFLQPFVRLLPSYVRDTSDFLRIINGITWNPNYLLLSFDVTSLYTCIPQNLGIDACKHFLRGRSLSFLIHTNMILDMILICLKNNFFIFHKQLYKQTQGTAMGTCFSPSFAGLYLGWWEELVVNNISHFCDHAVLWVCYIDDIFCIWNGSEEQAK